MEEMVFMFNEQKVRTVGKDGEPWFVAKDVCDVLEIRNSRQTTSYLDDDERDVITNDTPGGDQQITVINESGLYSLILRSRKPDAKKFKKWVTGEVLPAIRKHGGYLTPAKVEEALLNPDTLIRLATELKEERAKRIKAEQTKALIGSHREATAMNRASQAVKQLEAYKNRIGVGMTWKRVTCIPWLGKYFDLTGSAYSMIGKTLSILSDEMGHNINDVPDEKWGKVKAYHIDVVEELHRRIKADKDGQILKKYRKQIIPNMEAQQGELL